MPNVELAQGVSHPLPSIQRLYLTAPYSPSSLVFLSSRRRRLRASRSSSAPRSLAVASALTMVHLFPRPAVATSIISLFSVFNPVSAHVKSPLRPRAHAAAIQLRSFNAVDVDFARRENVPLEVRPLNERGLLDVVDGVVGGVTTLVGAVLGGGSTTTTTTAPANPTPAPVTTTVTQGSGGGNTGNPGNPGVSTITVTDGSGNPTHSNTQNTQNSQNSQSTRTNPSATASNPGQQQTSKAGPVTATTTGKALSPQPARNQSHDHKPRCKWFYRSRGRSRWNRLAHTEFRSVVGRFRCYLTKRLTIESIQECGPKR